MNIEEECKAFAEVLADVMAEKTVAEYGEQCRESAKRVASEYIERNGADEQGFLIWLAAKAHAAEMAKPVVYIRQRPHGLKGFGVYIGETFHKRIWLSDVKADAVQWAKDKGYRVIE